MIFARYIGPKFGSNFTPGKIYQGLYGFSGAGAVDSDQIYIEDDNRVSVLVQTVSHWFEFPAEVYGVVLHDVGLFKKGEVVAIVDASDEFYDIKGKGYFKADCFEVLDKTNVVPGGFVLNIWTKRWEKITAVDEELNVWVEDGSVSPVLGFRFLVGHGGVLSEPLVKCIDSNGVGDELTEGKVYRMVGMSVGEDWVLLANDRGEIQSYMSSRFSSEF
jgi:hypothetical protein